MGLKVMMGSERFPLPDDGLLDGCGDVPCECEGLVLGFEPRCANEAALDAVDECVVCASDGNLDDYLHLRASERCALNLFLVDLHDSCVCGGGWVGSSSPSAYMTSRHEPLVCDP